MFTNMGTNKSSQGIKHLSNLIFKQIRKRKDNILARKQSQVYISLQWLSTFCSSSVQCGARGNVLKISCTSTPA